MSSNLNLACTHSFTCLCCVVYCTRTTRDQLDSWWWNEHVIYTHHEGNRWLYTYCEFRYCPYMNRLDIRNGWEKFCIPFHSNIVGVTLTGWKIVPVGRRRLKCHSKKFEEYFSLLARSYIPGLWNTGVKRVGVKTVNYFPQQNSLIVRDYDSLPRRCNILGTMHRAVLSDRMQINFIAINVTVLRVPLSSSLPCS